MNQYFSENVLPMVVWTFIALFTIVYLPELVAFVDIGVFDRNDGPPWYFIYGDLFKSLAYSIGFLISLIVVYICYRNENIFYLTILLFSFIWFGVAIGDGIIILLNSNNIFNPDIATTNWKTFDDYINNPWKSYLYIIYLVIAVSCFIYFLKKKKAENTSVN